MSFLLTLYFVTIFSLKLENRKINGELEEARRIIREEY
jgi:hypothetical protein